MTSANAQNAGALIDGHGRQVRYLRISVTDRCNLCCRYCRDKEMPFIPHENILRYEEIEEIIAVAAGMGVRKLRFTGGEPFARKGFLEFLRRVRSRFPYMGLRLTTNGTLIGDCLEELKELGAAVNLSLDTLDRQRFAFITGRDLFDVVFANMKRMLDLGIPLKINAVAMRGVNDGELFRLAGWCINNPVDVRFIEFMPMGDGSIWSKSLFWPAADILAEAGKYWRMEPNMPKNDGEEHLPAGRSEESGPASLWKLKDDQGRVSCGSFGLITSVTHGFCASCNRLRLTAEGNLRTCLYDDREYPVRDALRTEGTEAIRRIMIEAVKKKPVGSELLARRRGPVAHKRMSAIGG